MSRKRRQPSYRLHRARNCAVVTLYGHNHYLGEYESPESYELYARLIAAWRAGLSPNGQSDPDKVLSVNEMLLAYWRFAKTHYQKDGQPTKELACMREALRPLRDLYGSTPAGEFGPKALKALRQHMVDQGLSRGVVNHRIGRIKRAFKWAVAEELIFPSVFHGLQAVGGLRFGQTQARETEPIRPIADLYVALVLPFVTPHVAAMVKLQRLSGMRAGNWSSCGRPTSTPAAKSGSMNHSTIKTAGGDIASRFPLGPKPSGFSSPSLTGNHRILFLALRRLRRGDWNIDRRTTAGKERPRSILRNFGSARN